MYRIEVEVLLAGRDGTMGLSRWLKLPFAPFPGLQLYGLTIDPATPETVESVAWDLAEGCFHIELEERHGDERLSALIDVYGPDWELHEPGLDWMDEC